MNPSLLEKIAWIATIVSTIIALITIFIKIPIIHTDNPRSSSSKESDPIIPVEVVYERGDYCCGANEKWRRPLSTTNQKIGVPCFDNEYGTGVVCK